jgi:hypothetical protein
MDTHDEGLAPELQGGDLPPELELVAQLLASGHSDAGAALAIGRSAKTVQRARTSNPAFCARVRELKEQRAAQAAAGLGALLEDAVAAVQRGLASDRTSDQLRAAALVLDRFRSFRADTESAERVAALAGEIGELRESLVALRSARQAEVVL